MGKISRIPKGQAAKAQLQVAECRWSDGGGDGAYTLD